MYFEIDKQIDRVAKQNSKNTSVVVGEPTMGTQQLLGYLGKRRSNVNSQSRRVSGSGSDLHVSNSAISNVNNSTVGMSNQVVGAGSAKQSLSQIRKEQA